MSDDVETIRRALLYGRNDPLFNVPPHVREPALAVLNRLAAERDGWKRQVEDDFWNPAADAAIARAEAAEAERDELRARLQQQEQADSGDDRWSAVVSSAAQATPAPWQEDGHDIVAPNYRGDMIGRVGMLHFQGDARFVVALVNWFFAHAESAGGTTPPLAAPESASPSNQFGGASGASSTAALPTKIELREVIAEHVRRTEPFSTTDGVAAAIYAYLAELFDGETKEDSDG